MCGKQRENREKLDKTASDVVELLLYHRLTAATAESCTGGLLSGAITSVSGASGVFEMGICAYANRIKEQYLAVPQGELAEYGAVSRQVAMSMARGIRTAAGANLGLSTTGIAGPGGGTPEKPVGTVWIGWSLAVQDSHMLQPEGAFLLRSPATDGINVQTFDREYIRNETVLQALLKAKELLSSLA